MYRVMAHLARPDGSFPHINDGFLYWKSPRLAWAGRVLGEDGISADDLVYVGTCGRQGTRPRITSIGFEDAGLYVMRSDWNTAESAGASGPDARYLLFDAGPYGGFHGHEDKLSIEVYAYGQPFIVDPGCHNYDEANPYRAHFVSSQAHNTLLVDGKSQIRRWYRTNLRPSVTANRPENGAGQERVAWITESHFDYVSASYSDGYADFSLRKPRRLDMSSRRSMSAANIVLDVTHRRQILYVKGYSESGTAKTSRLPDYWLVVDTIQGEPHNYQLLFHTAPGVSAHRANNGETKGAGIVLRAETTGRARLVLLPAEPTQVRVTQFKGNTDPIQGWYSEEFGQKEPVTTVIFEYTPRTAQPNTGKTAVLTTLVYPCLMDESKGRSADAAIPSIKPVALPANDRLAYAVTWANGHKRTGTDYLMVPSHQASGYEKVQLGPCQCSSAIAGIRTDHSDQVITRFEWEGSV
jgi:hypothetical protein